MSNVDWALDNQSEHPSIHPLDTAPHLAADIGDMRSLGIARWSQLQAQGFVLAAAETDTESTVYLVHSCHEKLQMFVQFLSGPAPCLPGTTVSAETISKYV